MKYKALASKVPLFSFSFSFLLPQENGHPFVAILNDKLPWRTCFPAFSSLSDISTWANWFTRRSHVTNNYKC